MIEILVLENTITGIEYVNLLKEYRRTDWNISWVSNVNEAVEYAKNNKLHILVFDQRLDNNELGTTAFKEIIKNNSLVQGIMLSGMATADELHEAERYAGSCSYLNKRDVLELPYIVEEAIIKFYLSPRNRTTENRDVKIKRYFFPFPHKVRLKLLYHYLIDDLFTFDDKWITEDRARAGIDLTTTEAYKFTSKVIVSLKNRVNYDFKTGINMEYIQNSISAFFENEFSTSQETTEELEIKEERKASLPKIPDDPKKEFLTELRYEIAPIYIYYRAHFSLDCTLCGNMSFFDFDIYVPTNKLANRQVSIYTDKTKKVIML